MERFSLPLQVNFSCRDNAYATALSKATYIQNGYIKVSNGVAKLYNRPGLTQYTDAAWDTENVVAGHVDDGATATWLVTYKPSVPATYFSSIGSASGAPSRYDTIYSAADTATYANCDIKSVVISGSPHLFVKFDGMSGAVGTYSAMTRYASPVLTGFTDITDTDFPNKATRPGLAYLDTYLFVLGTDNNIYNSDVGDVTSWNALGYITPDLKGGHSVGIEDYKNHVVFFGTHNIQFFYDAATTAPASPLLPRKDLVYNFGVHYNYAKPYKRTWWKSSSGDILTFVGNTYEGKRFIGLFNGFQVERISNEFIDGLLNQVGGTYAEYHIVGYSYDGKMFIHLSLLDTATGDELAFYYDTETKLWHVFACDNANYVTSGKFDITLALSSIGAQVLVSTSYGTASAANSGYGRLYQINVPTASHVDTEEDGTTTHAVNLVIQMPRYRGEPGIKSRRKFQHELQLICDTQTSTDNISVQYSDDDYQTFSTARTIDMSATLKQLQRLGYFRERTFKLTYSGTNQVRLESLEGQIKVGMN